MIDEGGGRIYQIVLFGDAPPMMINVMWLVTGAYASLVAFSFYSSRKYLFKFGQYSFSLAAFHIHAGAEKRRQQRSQKMLINLVLFMFLLRTVHMVSNIYIVWLGFIKHGDTSNDTVSLLLDGDGDSSYSNVGSVGNFMLIVNSFIADSIMVRHGFQFLLGSKSES